MNRTGIFVVVLLAALLGFVVVTAWYLGSYQGPGGSFSGMMGQMMGNGGSGMAVAMPTGVWTLLVAFVALAVVGAVGAGYYVAYPEIKPSSVQPQAPQPDQSRATGVSWEVLIRTSKADEKKVLEVLANHGGGYLQKFVVKESGLSRLKTHRIVARLAERGVVTVEKSGNTNQVTLAPWLMEGRTKQGAGS